MLRFRRPLGVAGVAAATILAVAGCSTANHGSGSQIRVPAAYVQVPAATGGPTVGYLDIRNNGKADELVSVSTSVGGKVEFRAPVANGVTPIVMRTVSAIPIPADATTQLIPNSYHLLISGEGPIHDGKDIYLTLTFAHAGKVTIIAMVTNPQNGGSSYFLN